MKTLKPLTIVAMIIAFGAVILTACSLRASQNTSANILVPTVHVVMPPTGTVDSITIHELPVFPTATPTVTPVATATPLPTPTQSVGPGGLPFPLKTQELEYGLAAHLFYTNRDAALIKARDLGTGWIRQQIHWRDQEGPAGNYAWGELDYIVDSVSAYNQKLMLSIVRSPSFYTANGGDGMPQDPDSLGRFVEAIVRRYQGRIHAIEIWNEQNLAYENGGQVLESDAGHYVELLKSAYTHIKAVDPSVYVVAGPPASTATNNPSIALSDEVYLRAMYSYQNGIVRDYFDIQAVHPGGSANPPETLWPEAPSNADGWTTDRTFYFRRVEDIWNIMKEYGMDNHQIWITEYGWATANNSPGYEFGNQVSLDQQAAYIVGAMEWTRLYYPYVGNMFLWNLNFAPIKAADGNSMHEQASFGILNPDYSPRPSYWAIQNYLQQLRGQ